MSDQDLRHKTLYPHCLVLVSTQDGMPKMPARAKAVLEDKNIKKKKKDGARQKSKTKWQTKQRQNRKRRTVKMLMRTLVRAVSSGSTLFAKPFFLVCGVEKDNP